MCRNRRTISLLDIYCFNIGFCVRLHNLIHKSVPPFHAQQEILFQILYSSRNQGQDTDKTEGIAQYFIPVLQSIRYSLEFVL